MAVERRAVRDEGTGAISYKDVAVKPQADKWGNAQGNQHDLAVDGAFKGQTVAVLHLYVDGSFDFNLPKAALAEKGFSTYRWIDHAPSAAELKNGLEKSSQLWIISDSNNELTPEHVQVIKDFFDAGHGVYIWGDNQPYYTDANIVARALLGTEMSGDLMGDKTVGLQRSPGATGVLPNHLLTTGLENIYEGITIATLKPADDLHPLIYGSAGNLVAAYYDKDGKRAILDGGFTRLYMKWDTAGTARYVKNAASWLVNAEKFGDAVINPELKKPSGMVPVTSVPAMTTSSTTAITAEPLPATETKPCASQTQGTLPSTRTGLVLLALIAGMLVLTILPRRYR